MIFKTIQRSRSSKFLLKLNRLNSIRLKMDRYKSQGLKGTNLIFIQGLRETLDSLQEVVSRMPSRLSRLIQEAVRYLESEGLTEMDGTRKLLEDLLVDVTMTEESKDEEQLKNLISLTEGILSWLKSRSSVIKGILEDCEIVSRELDDGRKILQKIQKMVAELAKEVEDGMVDDLELREDVDTWKREQNAWSDQVSAGHLNDVKVFESFLLFRSRMS